MTLTDADSKTMQVSVQNIGGIEQIEVELKPGVTCLTGRNATNRTSLLKAIMAALGSQDVPLKADADRGSVELTIGEKTYTRQAVRRNGTVVTEGNPYLDDPEIIELFAFLLETNKARQAVKLQHDLRDITMRPVDTDAIQAEISELETQRQEVDERLETLADLNTRLPKLEEKRTQLESQIEDKRQNLETKRIELEEQSASVDESRERESEFNELIEELNNHRSELENIRFQIESERESVDGLQNDLNKLESKQTDLSKAPTVDVNEVEMKIQDLRSEKRNIESSLDQLQSTIQFNEEMLEGTNSEVTAVLRDEKSSSKSITTQLVEDDETVVCWTCGTSVEQVKIESTLDHLREFSREKRSHRERLQSEIQELNSEMRSLEQQEDERERLQRQIRVTRNEIQQRKERMDDLEKRQSDLESNITTLEGKIEDLENQERSEVLDFHKKVNQLEFDLDRLNSEQGDVEDEIDDIERQLDEQESLEAKREKLTTELTELRSEVERIEQDAVEQFNDHMDSVLELLDYKNIERIWIERSEANVDRRRESTSQFNLHLVRSTDSGTVYEDTIDHLSESEREVTGLIFTLAGYLVHDVHELLPFMLLDSLEAIDADRIAMLVDYFSDHVPHLLVALLPEDAAAFGDNYNEITML